jgi:hypothetical protein
MMKKLTSPENQILVYLFFLGGALFLYFNLLTMVGEQQFTILATAFLKGHLFLGPTNISLDASYYKGLAYWPEGIFPAILLLPFAFFFQGSVLQGYVQFFLNIINFLLLYKIALQITHDKRTSLWLGFAYIFATAYLSVGLVSWSWWFAQIVATTCVLLMVYEYLHSRRWLLIGICIACAMATRIDLLFAAIFPLLLIMVSKEKIMEKVIAICLLVAPIFIGLIGIGFYNYARFGSVIEFGYAYHIPGIAAAGKMLKEHGAWNLFYVPTNLYYLFLSGVQGVYVPGTKYLTYPFIQANPWGMSIFLTSPILLWCLKTKRQEVAVKASAVTISVICLFLLGYFGIGARQYGYRYALDFQPFLFILLCFAFQKGMSWKVKGLIIVSFIVNIALFPDIFTAVL